MSNSESSFQTLASPPNSSGDSWSSRMNSQRRWPGPAETAVRGRAGSQTWRLFGTNSRPSCGTTSQVSQSLKNAKSVAVSPASSRTTLLAPSQPITQRAESGPPDGPVVGPSTVSVTASPRSASAVTR